jgi:NitT/TauT family transport system permease protein
MSDQNQCAVSTVSRQTKPAAWLWGVFFIAMSVAWYCGFVISTRTMILTIIGTGVLALLFFGEAIHAFLTRWIFDVNAIPSKRTAILLGFIPVVAAVTWFFVVAYKKAAADPDQKLYPTVQQLVEGTKKVMESSPKTANRPTLLHDTMYSMMRFGIALVISVIAALFVGLHVGTFPILDKTFRPFLVAFNALQPMALLPVIFAIFLSGEKFKLVLVTFALFPQFTFDVYMRVKSVHRNKIVAAQTLASSPFEICYRLIMPYVWPYLLESVRIALKVGLGAVIVAEIMSSNEGFGHRLSLYGRYANMPLVIPYVLWIALITYALDAGIGRYLRTFRWKKY